MMTEGEDVLTVIFCCMIAVLELHNVYNMQLASDLRPMKTTSALG